MVICTLEPHHSKCGLGACCMGTPGELIRHVTESKFVLLTTWQADKSRDKLLGPGIVTLFGKPVDWEDGGLVSQRTYYRGTHPNPQNQNPHLSKIPRWWACTLKFEKHWFREKLSRKRGMESAKGRDCYWYFIESTGKPSQIWWHLFRALKEGGREPCGYLGEERSR